MKTRSAPIDQLGDGTLCEATLDDVDDDTPQGEVVTKCGELATTERTVNGIRFRLCVEHAHELDMDLETGR